MSLSAIPDGYDGMIIEAARLPKTAAAFELALETALKSWRKAGRRIVWLTIPHARAALIPVAAAAGFHFYQAQPEALTLVMRLQPDVVLPPAATHSTGISGAVINDENELLVVRELHQRESKPRLPGGLLEPGEHLVSAVKREVHRATGIGTHFGALLGLRHKHAHAAGASNIYFVCLLRPKTHEIIIDSSEIYEASWMPVQQYINHPDVSPLNQRMVRLANSRIGWSNRFISGYRYDRETTELIVGSLGWELRHRVSLIFYRDGKVLVMRRVRNGDVYYITPGGGVEPGETFEEAAVREAVEETSLDVVLGPEIATPSRRDFVDHTFLITRFSGTLELGGPEKERQGPNNTYAFEWVSLEEMNRLVKYPGELEISAVEEALAKLG